jgi:hypothetical protein
MEEDELQDIELSSDLDLGDVGGLDFSDLDMSSFSGVDLETEDETRYIKPKIGVYDPRLVKYDNAKKLAADHYLDFGERIDCIVAGSFIFGDYIEAYLTKWNVLAKEMIITTLSLSYENIISLQALMTHGYIDKLSIIVSSYFYSHERNGLIRAMYKMLDIEDRFQLSVAGLHTKTCQFITEGGAEDCNARQRKSSFKSEYRAVHYRGEPWALQLL